jgi:hypothetical protein
VVSPLLDKTAPSVFAAIDTALRTVGGVPTYLLTVYVPRKIIGLLCPTGLCARRWGRRRVRTAWGARVWDWAHNAPPERDGCFLDPV